MRHTVNYKVNASFRHEKLHGRTHLVFPAILLKEGVFNGLFYSSDELEKSAHLWNGRPVPVHHPLSSDGQPATANTPETEQQYTIGKVFNVCYDSNEKRLAGEIWIDEGRLSYFPQLRGHLNSGKLEVSTGLFSDDAVVTGKYKGRKYKAVVKNIKPDHLALLPGGKGACSWEDGCGVRINKKGEAPLVMPTINWNREG